MIVGSPEWLESKKQKSSKSQSIYECDIKNIPKKFSNISHSEEIRYKGFQQKMMDNGWRLCEGEDNNPDYFVHPTYPDTKFTAYTFYVNDRQFIIPISSFEKDKKGLACSFIVHPGTNNLTIRYNSWVSYWNTRKGRRRAKYYDYLDARQQKKKEIEEEEADIKKKQVKNSQI